ncbi:MAG: glucose-6-phosphate isomerase [Acidimicrobiaceae bacterium]|nr:glucose-6-phosphate isomerase [Acidimicrobiaceae bacterium]|tara:strand:+ start:1332 stop:2954 length:1623 start_codon:yes stop_codon:yes gene_type:complete
MVIVVDPTQTSQWKELEKHCSFIKENSLQELLSDADRVRFLSIEADNLFADFSKQLITEETVNLLADLAEHMNLNAKIDALFAGEIVNTSENRPALHPALRMPPESIVEAKEQNVVPLIHGMNERTFEFAMKVRNKKWLGATGKPITSVVNIGIGGSHLGPYMAYKALQPYSLNEIDCRFVSNIDPTDINTNLHSLDPETTLFIINSKSFTTSETSMNAQTALTWIEKTLGENTNAIYQHFVAVTANTKEAEKFGFKPENIFSTWDWVGGRFSVSSSASLAVMIAIGPDNFRKLLDGCQMMDEHFRTSEITQNMPALMGLIAIWNRNFFGFPNQAVIPYSKSFEHFPSYLEQLEMESNGKNIDQEGNRVNLETSPVVLGGVGTDAQHSFFQLFHQGTTIVPIDFIAFCDPTQPSNSLSQDTIRKQHEILLANCFAQSQALAIGSKTDNPNTSLGGNRPSTTILGDRLDPLTLGQLIALYEHKVFTMGAVWQINSFDQWGVELGKSIVNDVLDDLTSAGTNKDHDSSTASLIARYQMRRNL